MTTRQWAWIAVLGIALLYLLVTAKLAYDVLGAGAWSIVHAVEWAVAALAALAGALGILGAIQESSKSLALRVVNSRSGRIAILVVSIGMGTVFAYAYKTTPTTQPVWACTIDARVGGAPDGVYCPRRGFVSMREFDLSLQRASDLVGPATLVADVLPGSPVRVMVSSRAGNECRWTGGGTQSRLALVPACGSEGRFAVQLYVCDPQPPRVEGDVAAELHAAASLHVYENDNSRDVDCKAGGVPPRDAGVVPDVPPVPDAGPPIVCRAVQDHLPEGQRWVFAVAQTGDDVVLTPDDNQLAVAVHPSDADAPAVAANPDLPCMFTHYDELPTRVRISARAWGFDSADPEFDPSQCGTASPCTLRLKKSFPETYYAVAANHHIRMKAASELPTDDERTKYATAISNYAVARANELRRPLEVELQAARKMTGVPENELAIRYAETKLNKTRCDQSCLDDPKLDNNVRDYLRRQPHPFQLRTPPGRWRNP